MQHVRVGRPVPERVGPTFRVPYDLLIFDRVRQSATGGKAQGQTVADPVIRQRRVLAQGSVEQSRARLSIPVLR